jgi:hypothetical protein
MPVLKRLHPLDIANQDITSPLLLTPEAPSGNRGYGVHPDRVLRMEYFRRFQFPEFVDIRDGELSKELGPKQASHGHGLCWNGSSGTGL